MELTSYLNPETIEALRNGGYFLMFGLMVAEGPFVTIASAFLASLGLFNIFFVAILGWIGDVIGDILLFSIGRFGLKIFKKKTAIDTPEEENFIGKLDKVIHKNLFLAIIIIKFVPYAPPIGLPYLGRSKISLKKYLLYTYIASLPIPVFAAIIGFHIGFLKEIWQKSSQTEIILFAGVFLLIIIGILVAFFILKRKTATYFGNSPIILSETKNEKTRKTDEEIQK